MTRPATFGNKRLFAALQHACYPNLNRARGRPDGDEWAGAVHRQTTLAGPAVCAGVGLHSGKRARVALRPAEAGTGVVFRRSDLPGGPLVPARWDAVVETKLGTTLEGENGARVATVEHLMAAVAGMGVDNVLIEIDGPEIPAMDGSAEPFARLIARAGIARLGKARRIIKVLKTVAIEDGARRGRIEPSERFEIDIAISFEAGAIGRQSARVTADCEHFLAFVAPARTFALAHEVDGLRAAGLALGGSLENCVVVDGAGVVNAEGLRYEDEFARHKALDAMGDLALAGLPLAARYTAERPGHALNNRVLRTLFADPNAWTVEEATPPPADSAPARPRRAAARRGARAQAIA